MGREIFVGEGIGKQFDCRGVHRVELHGEWCRLDVTGGLNGNGDIGG